MLIMKGFRKHWYCSTQDLLVEISGEESCAVLYRCVIYVIDGLQPINRTAIAFHIVASIMLYSMSRFGCIVTEFSSFGRCVCFCEAQEMNCPVPDCPDIRGVAFRWTLRS